MNKQQYLSELKKELGRLPKEELAEALAYYYEYFDDAGIENESEVIKELGPPKDAAVEVKKLAAMKKTKEPVTSVRSGARSVWVILMAVCAAPVALPLIFALVITIGVLAATAFAIALTFTIAAAALILGGIAGIFYGIYSVFFSFGYSLIIIGLSLSAIGMGIFFLYGGGYLAKVFYHMILTIYQKVFREGRKG